jgi:hypothetical protein
MQTNDRVIAAVVTGAAGIGIVGYFSAATELFVGGAGVAAAVGVLAVVNAWRDGQQTSTAEPVVLDGECRPTPVDMRTLGRASDYRKAA